MGIKFYNTWGNNKFLGNYLPIQVIVFQLNI